MVEKGNRRGQEDNKHPANGQSQQAFRDGWERRWREAIEDEKRRRDKQSPNLDTKNQGMQRACDRPTGDWRLATGDGILSTHASKCQKL